MFKRLLDFLDARGSIEFVPLIDADEGGLLERIPKERRWKSFHLVLRDGDVKSGADALPYVVSSLPLGWFPSRAILLVPGVNRVTGWVYSRLSMLHDTGSCVPVRGASGLQGRSFTDAAIAAAPATTRAVR
jgi:predicted DCC family thiol-disulfide oxidoreductase YuxK